MKWLPKRSRKLGGKKSLNYENDKEKDVRMVFKKKRSKKKDEQKRK